MKRRFLFFLILLLFVGCKTPNVVPLLENEFIFDYRPNGYMPLIALYTELDSDKKVKLEFELDTGGGENILSQKGMKKLSHSFKPNSTTTYKIKIDSLKTINNFPFKDRTFSFRKDEFVEGISKLKKDGMINIAFFEQHKIITINFIERKIILDGKILDTQPILMKKINILGNMFYEIPVIINGKNDFAIIDTGTQGIGVLRLDYENEKQIVDDEKYLQTVDESTLTEQLYINIEKIQIGEQVYENQKLINSATKKIKIPDLVRNVILYNNTLGIDFFKDKIIQFDLENNLFRIK